jgi:diguanylate cyclase (GGDEF)-like protein
MYKNSKYETLLILDLDNFKYINDTFGHKKGDFVLKEFSWMLKKCFNKDLIGRWGGDEFLVATNKDRSTIKKICKEINLLLKNIQNSFDNKKVKKLSLSVGADNTSNISFEKKFKRADLALYKVKKLGKKGCLFYDEIDYIKMEKEELNK